MEAAQVEALLARRQLLLASMVLEQAPELVHLRAEVGLLMGQPDVALLGGLAADSPQAAVWLAHALLTAGDADGARAALPDADNRWHLELVVRCGTCVSDEAAVAAALRGIELLGGDAELEHAVAALTGDASVTRASDGYVRAMFDKFAPAFDRALRDNLGYVAPQRLVELLDGEPTGALRVLDAGCGTGLAGPLLAPWASHLVGVDLSPGMLARAAEGGCYGALHEAELTAWLAGCVERFDVVLSADVLIYFGRLEPLMAGFASVLADGGVVLVSIETGEGDAALQPTGRWKHSLAHACAAAAAAGLELSRSAECALRSEAGEPVAGMALAFVKRPSVRGA